METDVVGHSTDDAPARRQPWARLTWWLGALSLGGLAIPVLARLTGVEWGPLAYAVAVIPWVTLALVVPLVIALAVRSRALVVIAGVLIALCVAWIAPLYVGSGAAEEPALRVASLNLTFGNADADAVVALVKNHDVDVLALQELTPKSLAALEGAGLDEVLAHRAVHAEDGFTGTGLWSRGPITEAASLDGFVSQTIRARAQTQAGPLAVYSIHPAAPGPLGHSAWSSDLSLLAAELADANGPVVVVGDFNTTRDHRAFRDLEASGFVDAASQAGAGFQPTFPQGRLPFPVVAIDHVLVRDAPLRAVAVDTVAIEGADHRALIATYARQ